MPRRISKPTAHAAHRILNPGWWLVVAGWWLVVAGCWLVVGGWWLVVIMVVLGVGSGGSVRDGVLVAVLAVVGAFLLWDCTFSHVCSRSNVYVYIYPLTTTSTTTNTITTLGVDLCSHMHAPIHMHAKVNYTVACCLTLTLALP